MSTEPDATPVAPESTSAPSGSRRLAVATFVLAAAVLAVDQLTKWWALTALERGAPQRQVIGDFITFRLVLNPGAALSIGYSYTWVLTIVVIAVVVVIVRMIGRIRSRAWAVTLGMLLGGAVGNLADRLFREPGFAHGKVVDFIGYADWFTGNVADIAIVAAAVLLALLSILGIGLDGRREGHGAAGKKADDRDAHEADGAEGAAEARGADTTETTTSDAEPEA
ncbi:signal peptidase II [Xylanimonas allomyrinae]|uniref:Lipoprotein signal peptidase n=1 Tax=Xylanimonas allomyrinae TaxID=2509459 RepID=A0A4P6EJ46_9MICO|nr:signal peptidase II [Xylanimonas allomyrinae]QAY62345.1 signal peptidase II [Xylanimonas allomyrinae]